ncbi:uncharacterized protein LOC131680241 [Topomyia yanbarensis]|uniref:uncharacterized protein LOC131680241 n=1 Tax=Topomyia yanbarensis TaxID=2498891 RepID=UPI00273C659B|nr:uncharacterized protein LOC131680241 [Topomyia yanbarensis]
MTKESHIEMRELIEECTRHVDNLEFMEQKLEGVSELMVVTQLSEALDADSRKLWEATLEYGELPTYKNTIEFLKKRCQILERCESSDTPAPSQQKSKSAIKPVFGKSLAKVHAATTQPDNDSFSCHLCNKMHPTFKCEEFRALNISDRLKKAKELSVCFNCLHKGHRIAECKSKKNCMICKSRHNTLLHHEDKSDQHLSNGARRQKEEVSEEKRSSESQPSRTLPVPNEPISKESTICSCSTPQTQVLLMTAVVLVVDRNQKTHQCRAFIDPGSMSHTVSKRLAKLLDLPTTPSFVTVTGINGIRSTADKRMFIEIQSRTTDFSATLNCLVLPKVTSPLPLSDINTSSWRIPSSLELADPQFNRVDEVDLFIGCGLFWQLLIPGNLKLADELPELHNTKLGWIVTGEYNLKGNDASDVIVHSNAAVVSNLDMLVRNFWEIEEVTDQKSVTDEEEFCEEHFRTTHVRDDSGRFIVSLPFKENINELGNSKAIAVKRFFMLEKRLSRHQDVRKQYVEFMDEYLRLGHCREVDESKDTPNQQNYYLPHHAVLKPTSCSTE